MSKTANQTLPQVSKIEHAWTLPFTAFEFNYLSVPIMLNRPLRWQMSRLQSQVLLILFSFNLTPNYYDPCHEIRILDTKTQLCLGTYLELNVNAQEVISHDTEINGSYLLHNNTGRKRQWLLGRWSDSTLSVILKPARTDQGNRFEAVKDFRLTGGIRLPSGSGVWGRGHWAKGFNDWPEPPLSFCLSLLLF